MLTLEFWHVAASELNLRCFFASVFAVFSQSACTELKYNWKSKLACAKRRESANTEKNNAK